MSSINDNSNQIDIKALRKQIHNAENILNNDLKSFINIFNTANGTYKNNQNKNLKSLFNALEKAAGDDGILTSEELDGFLKSHENLNNYDSNNVMNLLSNAQNIATIKPSKEQIEKLKVKAFGHQTIKFHLENGVGVETTEIFDENFKKTKEIRRISSKPSVVEAIYFNKEGVKTRTERTIKSEPPKNETVTYEYTEDGGVISCTNTDYGESIVQSMNNEGKIIQELKYVNNILKEQIDYNYTNNVQIITSFSSNGDETIDYRDLTTRMADGSYRLMKSTVIKDGKEYDAEYDENGNTYVIVQNNEYLMFTIYGNDRAGAGWELARINGISEEEVNKKIEARSRGEKVLFPWEIVGERVLIPGRLSPLNPILVNRTGSAENIKAFNDAVNQLYRAYGCDSFIVYQGNYGLILEESHSYNELALELMRAEVSQDDEKVFSWWETNLTAFVNGEKHKGLLINEYLFEMLILRTANYMHNGHYSNYEEIPKSYRKSACSTILEHLRNHVQSEENVSHVISASDIIRRNYHPTFVRGEFVNYQSTPWEEAFFLDICHTNNKEGALIFDFGIMRSMVASEEKFNQGLIERRALDVKALLDKQGITDPLSVEYWNVALTTTIDCAVELRDIEEQIVLEESHKQYKERCKKHQEDIDYMIKEGNIIGYNIFEYYASHTNASRDSWIKNYIDSLSNAEIYYLFSAQNGNYGVIDTILDEGWNGHDDNNNKKIIQKLIDKLDAYAKAQGVSENILNQYSRPDYEVNVDVKRYVAWVQDLIVAASYKTDGVELSEEEAYSIFVNHYGTIIDGVDNEGEDNDIKGAREQLKEIQDEYCGITKEVQNFFADDGAGYYAVTQNVNNKIELYDDLKTAAAKIENATTAEEASEAVAEFKRLYKEITGIDFNIEMFKKAQSAVDHYQDIIMLEKCMETYDNYMKIVLKSSSNEKFDVVFDRLIDQMYNGNEEMTREEFKESIYIGMLSYNFGLDTERFNTYSDAQKKTLLYEYLEEQKDLFAKQKDEALGCKTLDELGAEVTSCLEATCGPKGCINIDLSELKSSMQNTSMMLTMISEIAITIALSFVPGGVVTALGRLALYATKFPSLVRVARNIIKITQAAKKLNNLRNSTNLVTRTVSNGITVGLSDAGAQWICEGKVDWKRSLKSAGFGGLGCINQALVAEIFPNAGYWTSELLQTGFNSADAFVIETFTGAGYGSTDFALDVIMDITMAKLGAGFSKNADANTKLIREELRDDYGRLLGHKKTCINSEGNVEILIYDKNHQSVSKTVVTKHPDGTSSFETKYEDGTTTTGIINEDGSASNVSRTIIGRDGNPVKIEIKEDGNLVFDGETVNGANDVNADPVGATPGVPVQTPKPFMLKVGENHVPSTTSSQITDPRILRLSGRPGRPWNDSCIELDAAIRNMPDCEIKNYIDQRLNQAQKVEDLQEVQLLVHAYNELNGNYMHIQDFYTTPRGNTTRVVTRALNIRRFTRKHGRAVTRYLNDNGYNTEVFKRDMQESSKFDSAKEYIKRYPNSEMSNYLYNEYLTMKTRPNSPERIQLEQINATYGTKIFFPSRCTTDEINVALDIITKELDVWIAASGGTAKLPPAIDFTTARSNWYDSTSAYGQGRTNAYSELGTGALAFSSLNVERIMLSMRHEMTHSNDLTRFGKKIPPNRNLNEIMPKKTVMINGKEVQVPDMDKCMYVDEFRRAGLPEDRIPYAYNNPAEFIARAAEGDMSKYSPEFKQLLIDFGMPEWMFNMPSIRDTSVAGVTNSASGITTTQAPRLQEVETKVAADGTTNADPATPIGNDITSDMQPIMTIDQKRAALKELGMSDSEIDALARDLGDDMETGDFVDIIEFCPEEVRTKYKKAQKMAELRENANKLSVEELEKEILDIRFENGKFNSRVTTIDIMRARYDARALKLSAEESYHIAGTNRVLYKGNGIKTDYNGKVPNPELHCKELIMSDAMFIEAYAIYHGIDITGKSPDVIFKELKTKFESPNHGGLDSMSLSESYLVTFFGRDSISDPITELTPNVGAGDKVVHELNGALATKFDADSEFKKNWMNYCENSDKAKSYMDLAQGYIDKFNEVISDTSRFKIDKKNNTVTVQVNGKPMTLKIENLHHLIYRAFQRDCLLLGYDVPTNFSDVTSGSARSITIVDRIPQMIEEGFSGKFPEGKPFFVDMSDELQLMMEVKGNTVVIHTIEFNMKKGSGGTADWAWDADYHPHFFD